MEPVAGRAINKALREHNVRRLIVATTMGVGDGSKHAHFYFRYIFAPTFLCGAVKDKGQMEREKYTIRAGINNLFDKDPPFLSNFTTGTQSIGSNGNSFTQYDQLGRLLFVSFSAKL